MDRLTDYHVDGSGSYLTCTGTCDKDDGACWDCPNFDALVDRLAAYEDTGLEPEEYKAHADAIRKLDVRHIQDLLAAERDRRLVVLPCKVGDTVYVTNGLFVSEYSISHVWYDGLFFNFKAVNEEYADDCCVYFFFDVQIGQTVFLTREAAEAALKTFDVLEAPDDDLPF